MEKQDITELIANILGIEASEITVDSDFYDDLNCDDKEMIELKLQLEDKLKIEFDETEFADIETVNDLFELIEQNSDEFLVWSPKYFGIPISKR